MHRIFHFLIQANLHCPWFHRHKVSNVRFTINTLRLLSFKNSYTITFTILRKVIGHLICISILLDYKESIWGTERPIGLAGKYWGRTWLMQDEVRESDNRQVKDVGRNLDFIPSAVESHWMVLQKRILRYNLFLEVTLLPGACILYKQMWKQRKYLRSLNTSSGDRCYGFI